MSQEERVEALESTTAPTETIIPAFQTPDTCVFCNVDNSDSIFFNIFRTAYQNKIGKEIPKQDKETCIHHDDEWLKHSLYSAGFMFRSFRDGKTTNGEIIDILKNKEQAVRLLTKEYDEIKNFTCACHLYLHDYGKVPESYYKGEHNIEADILVQNKIIQNKIKIHYEKSLEVLNLIEE